MDPLAAGFIRSFVVSENVTAEPEEPLFRKPSDVDSGGPDGDEFPIVIEPREGAPAPGEMKGTENNAAAIVSLFYTGGIITPPLEKFHRKETFDFWIRVAKSPQLAKQIADRLRLLLHDKRGWNMDGLEVIESLAWRPMQPVGSSAQGYSYTLSFIFELYAEQT